jgi:hypothetical protein
MPVKKAPIDWLESDSEKGWQYQNDSKAVELIKIAAPAYGHTVEDVFRVPEQWEEPPEEEEKKDKDLPKHDKLDANLNHTDLDAHSQMDILDQD